VRAAVVVVVALLAACGSLPGRPREADRPVPPRDVRDFAQLWGEQCAGCHGADGVLGPATALADPVYLAWADDATLVRVTALGVPRTAMPAFARSAGGRLDEEQVGTLVREMRARWARGPAPSGLPPYAGGGGDAARGAVVYQQRCAACHDAGGKGTPYGGSVVDPAYLALVSDQALRTAVVVGRPDLGVPDWRGAPGDTPLTAQEVSDVVAWVASHRGGGA
jgi:cytochrome c oxidase cbb3-type subunit 3